MSDPSSATIVVVDDNPATLYTTTRVLRAAGFTVREAVSGEGALRALHGDVDLVVLDVNLPDISGFEVCKRLRANPDTSHIPVIHLSATFVQDVDKVQGFQVGADGYLTHPVEPLVLVATVQAFLRARRAEDDTRRSEAKLRATVEHAPNGISLLDESLVYMEANAAMASILGCRRAEIVGRTLAEVFCDADRRQILDALRTQGRWRGTATLRSAAGREVSVDWHISKHTLPGVYLAIATDVTELSQLEQERARLLASERAARAEAERVNRQKDHLLAAVSHDLRTPLAAIVNWAQVMQDAGVGGQQRGEAMKAIERNAAVAVQLIADLLDVSRIESGKMHLAFAPIDAVQLVGAALDVSRSDAANRGVTVRQIGQPRVRWINGDATRLHQVVWNLLANAIKFTPRGGHVEVELRSSADTLEIVVRDNGEGIAAELLPHVFDRFRQEPSSKARPEGLGLGLSIVRHVVEMHGGSVRAVSAGTGKGATFIVKLPAREQPAGWIDRRAGDAPGTLGGIRVLVVDDDEDGRGLVERVLQDQGAVVSAASGVSQALELLDEFAPQLIVSDIGMPHRDGYDLIRTVRARGRNAKSLPAIALTAYSTDEERRRALAAGFQTHLGKPVAPSTLIATVARFADAVRAEGNDRGDASAPA